MSAIVPSGPVISPGIIPRSANRLVQRHQLGSIGKRRLDLDLVDDDALAQCEPPEGSPARPNETPSCIITCADPAAASRTTTR